MITVIRGFCVAVHEHTTYQQLVATHIFVTERGIVAIVSCLVVLLACARGTVYLTQVRTSRDEYVENARASVLRYGWHPSELQKKGVRQQKYQVSITTHSTLSAPMYGACCARGTVYLTHVRTSRDEHVEHASASVLRYRWHPSEIQKKGMRQQKA